MSEKVFQLFLVLFSMENSIPKICRNRNTGKLSNPRWRGRQSEIIRTKFGSDSKNEVPRQVLPL